MFRTLRHYGNVAWTAWKEERAAPGAPKRTPTERAFLPAAIEITDTPASPAGRAVAIGIVLFFIGALVWATFGHIDIHATAEGRIIPTGKVKVIEPLETGTVKAINIKEGDFVEEGALLLELDPSDSTVDRERLAHDLMTARIESMRLLATVHAGRLGLGPDQVEIESPPDADEELVALQQEVLYRTVSAHRAAIESIDGEIAQRQAELARVRASVAEREKLVDVINQRTEMFRELARTKTGSQARLLEVSQLLYEERSNLAAEQGRIGEVEASIAALELRSEEQAATFLSEAVTELAEVDSRQAALEQELIKATRRDSRNRLHSPVAGHVRMLTVHTLGEVVQTGEQLMTIVPTNAGLEVEAMLLGKDKGFVHAGQEAEIKVEAFPFTKYGTVPATVMDVSNDSIEDEARGLVFPVRVAMAQSTISVDGEDRALTPGMAVTAEVKTGDRRVIEFILTPLLRYRDEAARER